MTSAIDCLSMPLIDTLNWHLDRYLHVIDIPINTQSTLNRHLIVDQVTCMHQSKISRLSSKMSLSVNRGISLGSIEGID